MNYKKAILLICIVCGLAMGAFVVYRVGLPKDYVEAGGTDLETVWSNKLYEDVLCKNDLTSIDKAALVSQVIVVATYRGEEKVPMSVQPELFYDVFTVDEQLKGAHGANGLALLDSLMVGNIGVDISYVPGDKYLLLLRRWGVVDEQYFSGAHSNKYNIKELYYPAGHSTIFNITDENHATALSKAGVRILKDTSRNRDKLLEAVRSSQGLQYGYVDIGSPIPAHLEHYDALVGRCKWIVEGKIVKIEPIANMQDAHIVYFTVEDYRKGSGLPKEMAAAYGNLTSDYKVGDVIYGYFDDFMDPRCPITGFITKEIPPK